MQPGDVMVTSRRKPILTVIEDTGPGVHDTLVAACDHHLYEQQLGIKPEVRALYSVVCWVRFEALTGLPLHFCWSGCKCF